MLTFSCLKFSQKYTRRTVITRHDYAIDNNRTQRTLYVEVKRQDGWVEGGKRADGRGNAHERSCKFFTPGLLRLLREESGIIPPHLPFWTVFQGDITRDPCRVREVTCWYEGYEDHFFFWRRSPDPKHSLSILKRSSEASELVIFVDFAHIQSPDVPFVWPMSRKQLNPVLRWKHPFDCCSNLERFDAVSASW